MMDRRGFLKLFGAGAACAPVVAISGNRLWVPDSAQSDSVEIVKQVVSNNRIYGHLIHRDYLSILTPLDLKNKAFGFPFLVLTDMRVWPKHFTGSGNFMYVGTREKLIADNHAVVVGAWEDPQSFAWIQT